MHFPSSDALGNVAHEFNNPISDEHSSFGSVVVRNRSNLRVRLLFDQCTHRNHSTVINTPTCERSYAYLMCTLLFVAGSRAYHNSRGSPDSMMKTVNHDEHIQLRIAHAAICVRSQNLPTAGWLPMSITSNQNQ